MKKKKQIAILGSTGSIGTQALQVIQEHADLYEVYCLTANNRIELLAQQAHQFKPAAIVVANEQHYEALKDLMADLPDVKVYAGAKAIDEIVEAQPIDIVLTAMVGFAGLSPTIHAIKAHKAIALATKAEALKHPNWDMGAKITIDSATMMNKGFEVIEAKWLFHVPAEKIHVVVHPESIIHSMVEFADGAVIAQLGCPDMRLPISLAMAYPERLPLSGKRLDFSTLKNLTFFEPDRAKFPCLQLAFDAIGRGGNIPCAMNAANEAAVAAFLAGRIAFYDIPRTIMRVMDGVNFVADPSLDDIFATHNQAYHLAEQSFPTV